MLDENIKKIITQQIEMLSDESTKSILIEDKVAICQVITELASLFKD